MAYPGDYRRGWERDEERGERDLSGYRRGGEENWRGRGRYGESYGRSSEEEARRTLGQQGYEPQGGQSFYGQRGYEGETFGRERRFGKGYGQQPYGQGFGEQEFGRTGSQDWQSSRSGQGWSEPARGWSEQGGGEGRFGQHRGYSEEGGYDPQRTQGRQPESGMGGGFRESVGWAGEGYRRYGESYGRGPEGFDRETGSYRGYGTPRTGATRAVGGEWQGFGGTQSYGGGIESQRFGTPGRTRGRFTGRGPKGYFRSDDRIREDVSDRLEQHGEIDATEIEVRVENGEVTLEGTVEDRRTKRMAEEIVDDLPGVKQVHNRIRVQGERSGQATTGLQTGSTTGGGPMEGSERSKGGSTTKSSTRT